MENDDTRETTVWSRLAREKIKVREILDFDVHEWPRHGPML